MKSARFWLSGLFLAMVVAPVAVSGQPYEVGTAFTYQVQLKDDGKPVNGACDFEFELYDASSDGNQVGSTVSTNGVEVVNGLFTVSVDFGEDCISGDARWLEIAARVPPDTLFTVLSPRQELRPTPYALALPGLWTQQNARCPNLIGGYSGNATTNGVVGAAIGGGGRSGATNRVLDNYGTVSGGGNNLAGNTNGFPTDAAYASVGGGCNNSATAYGATVSGGCANEASGDAATVGGGYGSNASAGYSTVGGGYVNTVGREGVTIGGGYYNVGTGAQATVGGGNSNTASGDYATVGGGALNVASGSRATVAGGRYNEASGDYGSVVAGGWGNQASGNYASVVAGGWFNAAGGVAATVAGGSTNAADGDYATVGGGQLNNASANCCTVAGGDGNASSDVYATIAGGRANEASGAYATAGGGWVNTAINFAATVGGGNSNTASGNYAVVAGGHMNTASGVRSMIPGGLANSAAGSYSFAAGRRAMADTDGAFVWADSNDFDFPSTGANSFNVRCTGGAQFVSAIDGAGGYAEGVILFPGSSCWTCASDRNRKDNFKRVDTRALLKRLAAIPIQTWNWKAQDPSVRHIGAMAQDFHAAFGVGEDDKHIGTVDADGVALAAIQGLYDIVKEKDEEIEALRAEKDAEIGDLCARLERIEALLSDSADTAKGGVR